MIPRLKPHLDYREFAAMLRLGGPAVEAFEQAFASKFGVGHAIAFPYGRSALLAYLSASGLRDREIVMPAYTCSVVAHAVVLSGNRPRFVDIELPEYNMDLGLVEAALNERTGAVISTHLFGYPLDVHRLREIVRAAEARFGTRIAIIQDCAHSFEARSDGRSVGRAGDVAFYGLNISKMITSIFGGMLTTDDSVAAQQLRAFRDANFRPASLAKQVMRPAYLLAAHMAFSRPAYRFVYWLQESSGLLDGLTKAYHLDDEIHLPPDHLDLMLPVDARVGMVQLSKYDEIVARRRRAASMYDSLLRDRLPWELPRLLDGATYSHYVIRVPDRATVMQEMARRGIQLGQLIEYSMPHLPAYRRYAGDEDFPMALECSRMTINLPVHASLRDRDIARIAACLVEVAAGK